MKAYLQARLTEKKTFWYCMFCLLVTAVLSPFSGDTLFASPIDYPYISCGYPLLCCLLWLGNALCLSIAPEIRARDFGVLFFGGGAVILLLLIPSALSGSGGAGYLVLMAMIFVPPIYPLEQGLQHVGFGEEAAVALALLFIALPLLLGAWYTERCYRKGMTHQEQTRKET